MPTFRATPYSAFIFLVELLPGTGKNPDGGFQEVSGASREITVAEHRFGNATTNYVTKIPGIYKSGDVTLKRGLMGATNLWDWLDEAAAGKLSAKRNIEIKLMSEDRAAVVCTWKLISAFPIKWMMPALNARGGGEAAVEELTLSTEEILQA